MNSRRIRLWQMAMGATLVLLASVAWSADNQSDITQRLDASARVLDEVMSTPNKSIPAGVITRATCVAVFPATVQVAVLVGAKHGKGFATCRAGNGWSAPAPLTIAGGSWGAQFGGQSVDLVMIITNEHGMQQLMSGKFSLGTETSVTAGPVGNHEWKMNEEAVTYAKARGVFAGMNLTGSSITQDEDDTRALYGSPVSVSEILGGRTQAPAASQSFLETVERYAGQSKIKD